MKNMHPPMTKEGKNVSRSSLVMVKCMQGNGLVMKEMDMECRFGPMDHDMKDIGR